MFAISFLREKCIGCNLCQEHAPEQWKMSKKDGKAVLLKGEKKGKYFVLKVPEIFFEENKRARQECPVNIIKIQ